jgi:hypothetical protein
LACDGIDVTVDVGDAVVDAGDDEGACVMSTSNFDGIRVGSGVGKDGATVSRYSEEGNGVVVGSGSDVGSIPPVSLDGIRVVVAVGERDNAGAADRPGSSVADPPDGLNVLEASGDFEASVGTDGGNVGEIDWSFGSKVSVRVGDADGGGKLSSSSILLSDGSGV